MEVVHDIWTDLLDENYLKVFLCGLMRLLLGNPRSPDVLLVGKRPVPSLTRLSW